MPILSKDLFRKPKNALESLGQRFNLTPAAAPDDLYATCPACKRASLKEELAQNARNKHLAGVQCQKYAASGR